MTSSDQKCVKECRNGATAFGWGPPSMFTLHGGVSSADYVILLMNGKNIDKVVSGQLELGRVTTAIIGSDDRYKDVDVVIYSDATGLYGGTSSIRNATLKIDNEANAALYGRQIDPRDIAKGKVSTPPAAKALVDFLNQESPKQR